MDKLLENLEKLKSILENSPTVPVWDKVILDKEKLLELISDLEKSIPAEFSEAKKIVEERDKILKRAYEDAEDIIRNAKEKAKLLVSSNNITIEAQKEAEKIINNAKKEATEIKKEMEGYINNLLNKVENLLEREIELIRKCKSEL
uniref:ATPase n=1 Tax=Dictyoglomus thermophilum TaxID=14 RepID=A0A7C3MI62_DICTH